MASLVSLVAQRYLRLGDTGADVRALQLALGQAGYNSPITGAFDEALDATVRRFQMQHGLLVDGRVGQKTAAILDLPHEVVVSTARPSISQNDFPHDDTASMVSFYGDPRGSNAAWQAANLVTVTAPWQMFYEKTPIKGISIHKKVAPHLKAALDDIFQHFAGNLDEIHRVGMHNFSGSYNYRAVRGSSRLSTHAFGASIDMDAERNPMTFNPEARTKAPLAEVAPFFKAHGAYWGGDYKSRLDPMHFQWAHE